MLGRNDASLQLLNAESKSPTILRSKFERDSILHRKCKPHLQCHLSLPPTPELPHLMPIIMEL